MNIEKLEMRISIERLNARSATPFCIRCKNQTGVRRETDWNMMLTTSTVCADFS